MAAMVKWMSGDWAEVGDELGKMLRIGYMRWSGRGT